MSGLADGANWTGLELCSVVVGGAGKNGTAFRFQGVDYVTQGEFFMARLLVELGLAFTPNVRFHLTDSKGRKVIYVPDFILNRQAYVWDDREVIHGFEAKCVLGGGDFTEKAKRKVRLLKEQYGIAVKLITDEQIKEFFLAGMLPIRPLYGPEP